MQDKYIKLSLALVALLVFSVLATSLTLANGFGMRSKESLKGNINAPVLKTVSAHVDSENNNETNGHNLSNEQNDDLQESVNESNHKLTNDSYRKIGISTYLFGQGWATSGDTGHLVDILWVQGSFARITTGDLRQVRNEFKDNRSQALSDLRNLANDSVQNLFVGRLRIGVEKNAEVFKLNSTSNTNDSLTFDIYSTKGNGSDVGNLQLNANHYSGITVWTGTLTINSGVNAGTYAVNIATSSKNVLSNSMGIGQAASVFNSQGNGMGFFQRMFGFFKNKKNN